MSKKTKALRPPAEVFYAEELAALAKADKDPRPSGWKLSPKAVRSFICGSKSPHINRKFFGDDVLVERAIIGLAGNRGLLLVGEPGTAKSMLSELLAAAISGCSTNTIQGSSGTTEDQIKYSWNYALLLAEGPSSRALVPGPLHVGMSDGLIVRFEEVTRCPPEIQDVLISIISEKVMMVPELVGRRPRADGPAGLQHHRHGQHPRPRRARDVQRLEAAFQLRDGPPDRRAGPGNHLGQRAM